MTIRPLDWRDIGLLHRIRDQGLSFYTQDAYTRGPSILQAVLLDALAPSRSGCTLVARPSNREDPPVVGQLHLQAGESRAHLSFLAPEEAVHTAHGIRLLEELGKFAGRRGAFHLIADVDEASPVFVSLREAGFTVYTHQRIWRCEAPWKGAPAADKKLWRAADSVDEHRVSLLYLNIVPALVQHVEVCPTLKAEGWVHIDQGEILGFMEVDRGPMGMWAMPYLHPAIQNLDEVLASFLGALGDHDKRPLYIAVRSYQGWVGDALERMGFSASHDQAIMVKRLAAQVRKPALAPFSPAEGTQPEPTTPFAGSKNH